MMANKKIMFRVFVGAIAVLLLLELLATHFITPNFNHLVTLFGFVWRSPIRLGWASLISISIIELTVCVLLTHYLLFSYRFPRSKNSKIILLILCIYPALILWNLDRLIRLVLVVEWTGFFGTSHLYRLYFHTHRVPLFNVVMPTMRPIYVVLFLIMWFCFIVIKYKANKRYIKE